MNLYLTGGHNDLFLSDGRAWMKLHLAERDPQHHAWPKRGADKHQMQLRILLSYWYYKDVDLDALFKKYFTKPYPEVFADSGGFSAMTQGAQINVSEYAAWVKRWQHLFVTYANLDAIGNAEGTAENQRRLEDMGLNPLPVFHVGEDFKHLAALIERYPYIALGGMVPYMRRREKIMPWLVKCFRMAQGKAVYHGFGATSWVVVSSLPWYSVDSSSWGQGFRFGQVPLFDDAAGVFREVRLGNYTECTQHAELITSLGFDPLDFADRKRNDRAKICAISALSYMKAEQWLRKHHGEVRIPTRDEAQAGLRLYGAAGNIEGGERPLANMSITTLGLSGIKLHLADARPSSGGDLAAADTGLKIHLAEHSLDRGGLGDTSRATDILCKQSPL